MARERREGRGGERRGGGMRPILYPDLGDRSPGRNHLRQFGCRKIKELGIHGGSKFSISH